MLGAAYCRCRTLQYLSHPPRQLTALTSSYPFGPEAIKNQRLHTNSVNHLRNPEKRRTYMVNAIICVSIMSKYLLPKLYAAYMHTLTHKKSYYRLHDQTTADLDQPPMSTHNSTAAPPYLYPWYKICQIIFASISSLIQQQNIYSYGCIVMREISCRDLCLPL